MGQYYKIYAEKDGNVKVWDVTELASCGIKLMEHSWLSNKGIGIIMREIMDNGPYKIIWCGDYADSDDEFQKIEGHEGIYKATWGDDRANKLEKEPFVTNCYLVNESKKCYVNMAAYIEAQPEGYEGGIHPLPLLTAAGNGAGCGDYYGDCLDKVGSWMYDEISVTENEPVGYRDITEEIKFFEQW